MTRSTLMSLVGTSGQGLSGPEVLPPSSFSGWEPKRLFTRLGEGDHFDDCAWSQGFDSRFDGRSLVATDLDGDGDLDLVMSNRAAPKLQVFENVGTGGNAFELELKSTRGHPEADGVTVQVEGNGAFASVLARGFVSSVSPRIHVGLGARKEAKVSVRWRSGQTEAFGSVPAGGVVRLVEGTGKVEPLTRFKPKRAVAAPSWPAKVTDAVKGGKGPLVVQIFERSCVPCREEVPILNALAAKGLKLTALGLHPAAEIEKVRTELKMDYPAQALLPEVAEAFEGPNHGLALPTLLVYGADGNLARVVPGGKQLEAALLELGLAPSGK